MKITTILTTATFAWSHDAVPLLASASVAGSFDIDKSAPLTLQIWDPFSSKTLFTSSHDSCFYAIAWSKPFEGRPRGLLSAAYEDGSIVFYDPIILLEEGDVPHALVHRSKAHSGVVKSLQFSPLQPHLLASGGSGGQVFIWDTTTFADPQTPGQGMSPVDQITCVAWNRSVPNILATTGDGGWTSIWDLKKRREVLHMSYTGSSGKASFSYVAWHPSQSTTLVTASESDTCPVILVWNLRNANAPTAILEGHSKGVLCVDWCAQDPDLLLSSGKDNVVCLWNPTTNTRLGLYPTTSQWAFQTQFAPRAPDVFATASFDGTIVVQTLQDTSPPVASATTIKTDTDFWDEIAVVDTQHPVFEKSQPPRWLECPVSVSFGFGSKLVTVGRDANNKSVVRVSKFVSGEAPAATRSLRDALRSNDFAPILAAKASLDQTLPDSDDWRLLDAFASLGERDAPLRALLEKNAPSHEALHTQLTTAPAADDSFFADLGDDADTSVHHEGTGASAGAMPVIGPFSLSDSDDSPSTKSLVKAVLANKIDDAISICLDNNKLVEAAVLALDASKSAKQKVKDHFLAKNQDDRVARILYSVSCNDISDIVANANVSDWVEIGNAIKAFSSSPDQLAKRLVELGERLLQSSETDESRNTAMTLFLAGGALDKIASVWLAELPAYEERLLNAGAQAAISSPGDVRFESLTNFVEKIAAFRSVIKESGPLNGPSVEPVAKAILEYVNLVAGVGEFELAERLLLFLPASYAGSEQDRIAKATTTTAQAPARNSASALANRVPNLRAGSVYNGVPAKVARTSSYSDPSARAAPSAARRPLGIPTSSPYQHNVPTMPPQPTPPAVATPAMSQASKYGRAKTNPYAPAAPAAPAEIPVGPPGSSAMNKMYPPTGGPTPTPGGMGGAPSFATPLPQPIRTDNGWNDLPEAMKATAVPRRAAPVAVAKPVTAVPQSPAAPANRQQILPPKRGTPMPMAPPPGPRPSSRAPSSHAMPAPPLRTASNSSRYAPPVSQEAVEKGSSNAGAVASPIGLGVGAPFSPRMNPYAPPPTLTPKMSFAPPPGQTYTAPRPVAPLAPVNPYALPTKEPTFGANPHSNGLLSAPKFGGPEMLSPSLHAMRVSKMQALAPPPPRHPPSTSEAPAAPPQAPPLQPLGSVLSASSARGSVSDVSGVPKHPKGDRSHIPQKFVGIYTKLNGIAETIKPSVPEKYKMHLRDLEKRLSILFDHLNNDDLITDGAANLLQKIGDALEARDNAVATAAYSELVSTHSDELGNWHIGVKRLITMAEALY